MNNIIGAELEEAKKKMISTDEQNPELVQLTRDNVAIVEAMIRNDSAYIKSSDKNACPKYKNDNKEIKYNGSTAFWMSMLQTHILEHLDDFISQEDGDIKGYFEKIQKDQFIAQKYENARKIHSKDDELYKHIIERAVIAVDNENSTHINSDGVGRAQITGRICTYNHNDLLKSLWNRDLKLFKVIESNTNVPTNNGKTENSKQYRARTNTSFASKFCHYACFYLFEGADKQDNYSIYDNILRTVLPRYIDHYKLRIDKSLDDYDTYSKAVDKIRDFVKNETKIEISRNGFDHLLWYYHKGRL